MTIGSGYLERVNLNVLNVVGPTRVLEAQLEFTKLLARLRKSGRALRLMFDFTNAQLQGDRHHLRFFLSTLDRHTAPNKAGSDEICIVVVDECPLRNDLSSMADVFHSKLALLDRHHSAFAVAKDRHAALHALESISVAGV